MNKVLYYKCKLIPKKLVLDNLRHIINNYYNKNETNLDSFQKSLNINYKLFIQNKIKKKTDKEIKIY